jgi:hypothetical protein
MPEPITTTALATAAVTALTTKAFEEIGKESGTTVLSLIKGLFTPDELTTLNLSADALQDPKAQGKLEGKLEERLAAHPDIAKQLEVLLASLPKAEGKTNTLMQTGDGNVGLVGVTGSKITITKG